ncbi:ABC transporter permease [Lewinella cohaerens]|uniref:ABC transporter permease n=1 Tax=Lewinella cohaerens TaxID=70995 RepID=UPI00035EBA1D|nr:ABC transporter permease subunit [Lewinella cohaerens]
MASLLHLRNRYDGKQQWIWALAGFIIVILIWWGMAETLAIERPLVEYSTEIPTIEEQNADDFAINIDSLFTVDSINLANATEFEKVYPLLPPPHHVVAAFPVLKEKDELFLNTWISIWRNLRGYFWAIFIALAIGFPLGLVPAVRALFSKQVDALRYLPITAITGLFILWFGVGDNMKVAFLAFGILVYLLPVVIQRINEVEEVYLKTVFTLSATNWQMIRSVYLPSVLSKLMDDIRVLTAISWTYIIIAELLNRDGGVGAMIWVNGKYGKVDKVFAWLIIIILVGFLQDRLFIYLDKRLFPHKYYKTVFGGLKEVKIGFLVILGSVMLFLLLGAFIPSLASILSNLMYITVITGLIMILYGEFRFQRSYTK